MGLNMRHEISSLKMWDEIMEVSEELDLSDWETRFLEDIEARASDENLSEKQYECLCRIYKKACDSPH
jgi:hypothetical protein